MNFLHLEVTGYGSDWKSGQDATVARVSEIVIVYINVLRIATFRLTSHKPTDYQYSAAVFGEWETPNDVK